VQSWEVVWWLVAIATFGVGDGVTTVIGTRYAGLVERSPVVRRIAGRRPSIPALVGLKLLAFGAALVLSRVLLPSTHHAFVPLGIAVVGVGVTGFNVWAMYSHGRTDGDGTARARRREDGRR